MRDYAKEYSRLSEHEKIIHGKLVKIIEARIDDLENEYARRLTDDEYERVIEQGMMDVFNNPTILNTRSTWRK